MTTPTFVTPISLPCGRIAYKLKTLGQITVFPADEIPLSSNIVYTQEHKYWILPVSTSINSWVAVCSLLGVIRCDIPQSYIEENPHILAEATAIFVNNPSIIRAPDVRRYVQLIKEKPIGDYDNISAYNDLLAGVSADRYNYRSMLMTTIIGRYADSIKLQNVFRYL